MYIKGNINSDVNGIKTVDFLNTTQGRLNTVKKSINKPNKKGYSNNLLNTITTSGMPNVVSMTHVSTQLIENVLIGKLIGNVSYKITTQLNDSNLLYAYTNIGNGEVEYGIGLNVGNFYGLSAYTSSNLGIGISSQLAPWFTYGSEVSLINGVTFSFGTISGNITSEVSVNVGWGTIAGAYAIAAGLTALPIPGARLVAGLAVLVILIIDINN